MAQQAQDQPNAVASLERALRLAEPEGYVRVFIDEGAPMAALLTEVTQVAAPENPRRPDRRICSTMSRRLLAAFETTGRAGPPDLPSTRSPRGNSRCWS